MNIKLKSLINGGQAFSDIQLKLASSIIFVNKKQEKLMLSKRTNIEKQLVSKIENL